MIIADRGGHTQASPGASARLDELSEDRKLIKRVNELLSQYNTIISCQQGENIPYPAELSYGIRVANENGAELFFSIHLNKCYDDYSGALGSEIEVYPGSELATELGNNILNNLESIGFKNRGLKDGRGLGEIDSTIMDAMIIEVCFVEAAQDVENYNNKGIERIARAIANGIDNRVPLEDSVNTTGTIIIPKEFGIEYSGHLQDLGWAETVKDGQTLGTTGEAKRLEAICIRHYGEGRLKFQCHVQNLGWTAIRENGEIGGTAGMGLRLEAIKIWIEGKDVAYRVHVQNKGWTEWKYNGQVAGTVGEGLRIEAIEIHL